jgi:hypothetical protein
MDVQGPPPNAIYWFQRIALDSVFQQQNLNSCLLSSEYYPRFIPQNSGWFGLFALCVRLLVDDLELSFSKLIQGIHFLHFFLHQNSYILLFITQNLRLLFYLFPFKIILYYLYSQSCSTSSFSVKISFHQSSPLTYKISILSCVYIYFSSHLLNHSSNISWGSGDTKVMSDCIGFTMSWGATH